MDKHSIENVSRETLTRLKAFESLVVKWNPKINLVSKSSLSGIWDRHIIDSLQLFRFAPQNVEHWLDIGSGGGFPGIVMASIAQEVSPGTKFTFIESDQRKVAFLRTANRELGLNVTIIDGRVESTPPQNADVISARALSSLSELMPMIKRHQKAGGLSILPKGKTFQEEIDQAKLRWCFDVEAHQSVTDNLARILIVNEISSD